MASTVLPDSKSSLTKYIELEAHYKLLKHIETDTTVGKLKERFDEDVVATACKRYLTVEGNLVKRDKLIDLVQEDGNFSTRVKMVMYFVFPFRDPRYRGFICDKVAIKDGRWDATAFRTETGSFFQGSGRKKAFTNLCQLLVQAELLQDKTFRVKPFPDLAEWFPYAVETAAGHIANTASKQEFLSSPRSFLVKHRLNGLLNATPAGLKKVQLHTTYEDPADQLPTYADQTSRSASSSPGFHSWNKSSPPKKSDLPPTEIQTNPALLERANNQHFLFGKVGQRWLQDGRSQPAIQRPHSPFCEHKHGHRPLRDEKLQRQLSAPPASARDKPSTGVFVQVSR